MEKLLEELANIAKEACDIGKQELGGSWQNLTNNISVYNAANSDYQAAEMFGIKVSLHRTVRYEIQADHLGSLKRIVTGAQKDLRDYKEEITKRSKEESDADKQARINKLKQQLQELEGSEVEAL